MKPNGWLLPLSIPYRVAIQVRNRLYDLNFLTVHDVELPVISVGNISAGGTGKTPFVIYLLDHLKKMMVTPDPNNAGKTGGKKKLAVISRGYKGSAKGTAVVNDGKRMIFGADVAGDEPVLIAESSPGSVVISDKDRVRGAEVARDEYRARIVILDDGFQHRRIKRDLDIVLLDGQNPFGNNRLLPAGFLREPAGSLSRADIVVLSKAIGEDDELRDRARKLEEIMQKPVVVTRMVPKYWRRVGKGEILAAHQVEGKTVAAFAGIASPGSFFDTVADLGADMRVTIPLPDHCSYSKLYVDKISNGYVRSQAEWLVTSAKDAVKIPGIMHLLPIYYLQADIEVVSGIDSLDTALRELL